jgi:GTP cyclohydrolase I
MSENLEQAARLIISGVGEESGRVGLERTPERFAKAFRQITSGYSRSVQGIVGDGIFPSECEDPVIVSQMKFFSVCEHHLLPFHGQCSIAYVPNGRILGLSKIPKIVELFAQRLQVQEHLTRQIGSAIEECVAPRGVAVIMSAMHLCSVMRNHQDYDAPMITMYRAGLYRTDEALFESFRRIAFRE